MPAAARVCCHCVRRCGGPNGSGKMIAYSTFKKHQREDPLVLSSGFSKFLTANRTSLRTSMSQNSQERMDVDGINREGGNDSADGIDWGSELPPETPDAEEDLADHPLNAQTPPANASETPNAEQFQDHPLNAQTPPANASDCEADPGSLRDLTEHDDPLDARTPSAHSSDQFVRDAEGIGEQPDTAAPNFVPIIEDIKTTLAFIDALKEASLDSELEPLDEEVILQIRHPHEAGLTIDGPFFRLSIDIYLATGNASEQSYNSIRTALLRENPDMEILTYHKVKRLVAELSGVNAIERDMCINSCIGYTGPYADAESCPFCGEPRYDPGRAAKVPRKRFTTLPLAPQLQALWRTPDGAERMSYRERCTRRVLEELELNHGIRTSPFKDFFDGTDYLEAVMDGRILAGDMVLVLSIDGAQLYRSKVSECWLYIWIILDQAPDLRYQNVQIRPGGFIPGPNKPKNMDSFLFPGLYHLAALQREGLRVWDALQDRVFTSHPFLALVTADGPAMACISGFVGHQGKMHCRVHCPIPGRHKPGAPQYYPARLKPHHYTEQGCDHPDVDLNTLLANFTTRESEQRYQRNLLHVINSPNQAEFKRRRLATGICKPTIFSGLPPNHILGIPGCFALDIMHLPALNLTDLLIPLWRGKLDCDKADDRRNWPWAVLKGSVWTAHGQMVVDATPYIPGSFDRPPRNPAEKISSGYKAWEFLLYFFGLGPCLFHGVLPDQYWRNYCKAVRGFRILMQEEISPAELKEAHERITSFSDGFETLYYQRRTDRLHFIRPSIHTPSHLALETQRVGPPIIYSQWAIERTIGNLGEEIRLHSNAFANLAQRGVRRCQINALKSMIPDIEPSANTLPRGAKDLGDGYVLLRAVDNVSRPVRTCESVAIRQYLLRTGENLSDSWSPSVTRWARIRLPNGQIARSQWKEKLKPLNRARFARNIRFSTNGRVHLAEVYFYMLLFTDTGINPVALVSLFGPPHPGLLEASSHTYWTSQHQGDTAISVIDIKSIESVIMMAPDQRYQQLYGDADRWYLMEKPGLKLTRWYGIEEEAGEGREDT